MDKRTELDPEPGPVAAIRELLSYNWADEERNYREDPPDETGRGWHIFERMQEIKAWLDDAEAGKLAAVIAPPSSHEQEALATLKAFGFAPVDILAGALITTLADVWRCLDGGADPDEVLSARERELADAALAEADAGMEG